MKSDRPYFSIITVSYNSVETIEKTIKSVISQTFEDFEYIIIDGGSTDGTLDIINKYRRDISIIISEKDDGVYDAFNKGIKLARGKFIGILNSDDTYSPDVLYLIKNEKKDKKNIIYYGDTYFIDNKDVVFSKNNGCFNPKNLISGIGFMHPSCFVSRYVYEKIGLYEVSTDKSIASDAFFLLKCYKNNIDFEKSNHKVFMRTGGLSEINFFKAHKQYLKILKELDILSKGTYSKEIFLLLFKGPIKKILSRKRVANTKLQVWFIFVAIFNLFIKYIPNFFLKKKLLKLLKFKIGNYSYIHNSTFLSIGKLSIGNHSVINSKCLIDNRGEIFIGNNVSIAHQCKIYTTGHDINCNYFTGIKKPVYINDYAVLFSSCIIQPGVTIGEGAVVFPGSVVTKNVEPYTLVGGSPAKVIGKRNNQLNYSLDYGFLFAK